MVDRGSAMRIVMLYSRFTQRRERLERSKDRYLKRRDMVSRLEASRICGSVARAYGSDDPLNNYVAHLSAAIGLHGTTTVEQAREIRAVRAEAVTAALRIHLDGILDCAGLSAADRYS
jgi:hypothetical protein